ncbi:alpha/beta fold hydrolase [Aeromicrobium wangtongii]|uniref:Alpha/beta hydrolase n=1 Tax=Aeromicrobium wangtongii TaxID=2969247 RepID=A0ABY5M9N3_9ACTN|nr:alpha/beta hydrolase [Aeromicrobium wangtongii]MCD9199303.1 alpha/beta hydrolase [Aeromicrobium wangtongii]UUP13664.1 alpha/beta hydrolase [Aeromicrobium wangtongii]
MLSELAYTRKGSGEPLVLIHGIGHRRQAWNPVLDLLAQSHDVIAVDLAGFGESPAYPASASYDMDHACQNLSDNFAAWGIDRPHVAGNSLGGAIALELGARGLARSVTALSPAGFFGTLNRIQTLGLLVMLRLTSQLPDRALRTLSRSAVGRRLAGFSLYTHPERFTADEVYGDALALKRCTGFERTIAKGGNYAFRLHLDVPTTIAWGTRDLILPYSSSAIAQERLPEADHVALPHCGHVPMVDDPDLVARVIQNTTARTQEPVAAA